MDEIRSGCPCLYLKEPCRKYCTCVSKFSSAGCLNCSTYGSLEQRTAMAEYLNMIRLKGEDCFNKEEQAKDKNMKTGIELIAQERAEQIKKHSYTIDDDIEKYDLEDSDGLSELSIMAIAAIEGKDGHAPAGWDLVLVQKICDKTYKERLIIAGALIAAEIDRLNYQK